jgi:hypothetical protein
MSPSCHDISMIINVSCKSSLHEIDNKAIAVRKFVNTKSFGINNLGSCSTGRIHGSRQSARLLQVKKVPAGCQFRQERWF